MEIYNLIIFPILGKERDYFMNWLVTAMMLGLGLAMDACAVSTTDGLSEPKMKWNKILLISGMFGFFQMIMPVIGYLAVTVFSLVLGEVFTRIFSYFVPYLALVILCYLGIKLIVDTIKNKEEEKEKEITFSLILVQAIATSIDALSVGVVLGDLVMFEAMMSFLIVGIITFIICVGAIFIGKKFGNLFSSKAGIVGGSILIFIGFEIFFSNWDLVVESFKLIFKI